MPNGQVQISVMYVQNNGPVRLIFPCQMDAMIRCECSHAMNKLE